LSDHFGVVCFNLDARYKTVACCFFAWDLATRVGDSRGAIARLVWRSGESERAIKGVINKAELGLADLAVQAGVK